jgi:hypothetical protein
MIIIKLKVYPNDSKRWYQNNWYHRDNDQPAVIYSNGTKRWYQNGKFIKTEYPQ